MFIIIAVEPGHFPQPPCSDSQEAESEIVEVATNGPRTGQVFQSSQHAHLHRAMSGCSAWSQRGLQTVAQRCLGSECALLSLGVSGPLHN